MIKKPNTHKFLIEDAQEYGVDAAVILYNIRYWLTHEHDNLGKDNCKNFDGYVWTFNSAKAFSKQFPYFSSNKIQKILKKLENDGVIICGNFNKKGYDRTKWYTMSEYKIDESIQPNKETHSAKLIVPFSQTAEPIPDNKQQIINNNNIVSIETKFEDFWKEIRGLYRKYKFNTGSKQEALKAFKKQKLTEGWEEVISNTDKHLANKRTLLDLNNFVPNPKNVSGWINNRCWEDDLEIPVKNNSGANGGAYPPPGSAIPPRRRRAFGED